MGGFIGHAVAGTMFLTISVWWFIGDVLQMNRRSGTLRAKDKQKGKRRSNRLQLVWYQCPGPTLSKIPLEPMIKVVLSAIGILVEMPFNNSAKLYDEQGELITKNLRNHGHALMYGFFGLSGIVDLIMWYRFLPLPPKFDYLVLSLAFWVEGFLFYLHLHGRDELNVHVHCILYILVFVTALVFFLAVVSDRFAPFVSFSRSYLLSLQGSWFFQIASILHGSRPWENTSGNVELSGIVFSCHALVLFIVHLSGRIICFRFLAKQDQLNELLLGNYSEEEEECSQGQDQAESGY